ncbi:hypothetical protein TSOC_003797 [Tetrabaena socialis]|uniref:Uncharacterized protein n=1 Tax=Tetrabaena socialis TaxID=47790 RepID=A0A2J8AAL5_9CHLO|nr:hypothetical protein TSOC_003797 [Tetrabaena socialis]|eukprot:PNH09555.1 hypothetical protein TSOC_003797 [Tetrabaena socialis]
MALWARLFTHGNAPKRQPRFHYRRVGGRTLFEDVALMGPLFRPLLARAARVASLFGLKISESSDGLTSPFTFCRGPDEGMSAHMDTEWRAIFALHLRLSTDGRATPLDFIQACSNVIWRLMVPHGWAWIGDTTAMGSDDSTRGDGLPWFHGVPPTWVGANVDAWSITAVLDLVAIAPRSYEAAWAGSVAAGAAAAGAAAAGARIDALTTALAGLCSPLSEEVAAAETGRARPSIPQLQLPVLADAYSVGHSIRGFTGGTACFQAQRGPWAPENEQKVADGRSKGGLVTGPMTYEQQLGLYNPANAQVVADGNFKGGLVTGPMFYEQQLGLYAPKNAQKVADGCSAGGAAGRRAMLAARFGAFFASLLVLLITPSLQSVPDVPTAPPQYYINFGRCGHSRQQQQYGNWVMTYPLSKQEDAGLIFYLDTRNTSAVAKAFGEVEPLFFPIRNIYFAYFNNSGIQQWSPTLDRIPYKETAAQYQIKINGKALTTVKDLKDSGFKDSMTSVYSLKGTLVGSITPSVTPYKVEVVKKASRAPDPKTVFTSPTGHIVFSLYSVGQPMTVNGVLVRDHAWCPVQTAVNVR